MAVKKLTETSVERIKAPDPSGRQRLYWDTVTPGFGVVASGKTTAKSYVVQCEVNGKSRRVTIGRTAVFSLERAREEARTTLADMHSGIDPKAKRKAEEASAVTLRQALDGYLADRKDLRPKTREDYRKFAQYLDGWLDKPLRNITREMVRERHQAIKEEVAERKSSELVKGHSAANMAMTVLRLVWNHVARNAEDAGGFPSNPVSALHRGWYPQEPRDRVVRASDLPAFYTAVTALRNPIQRDFLLLVLFTGLRLGEAAALRWDEVDLPERVIRLPKTRTKGGRKLDLPMSDYLHDLFVARRALGIEGAWVFPANSGSGHIVDLKFAFRQIAETTGIKLSVHDLRRTFITVAESCNIPIYALKGLVNHSMGTDITAGYIVATADRLREPMQQVTDRLKAHIGLEGPQGNVAKIG